MTKRIIAVMTILVLVVPLLAACGGGGGDGEETTTPTVTATSTTTVPSASTVTIKSLSFKPETITVPVGTTLTWINDDSVSHAVVSDTGLWQSNSLGKGDSFRFTFSQPGTFTYHCRPHSFMTGKIIVQ